MESNELNHTLFTMQKHFIIRRNRDFFFIYIYIMNGIKHAPISPSVRQKRVSKLIRRLKIACTMYHRVEIC